MNGDEIQALVNEKLDQARDNGYDGGQDDPSQVAISLADEDTDVNELVWNQLEGNETVLIPFIKVWQQRQLN